MILDVRTIVVLLIVASMLMTVTFAVGIRSGRGGGFEKWNVALGLFALGWLLVAARGALPDVLTLAAADAFLLAGLCSQLAAVIEFGGARPWRWLPIAPPLLLLSLVLPILDDYALFTFATSASYCVAFVATGIIAARLGKRAGPPRWILAGAYLAAATAIGVRAAVILADPKAYPGLYSGSPLHAAAFVMLFVATAMGSIAFLLMLRERAEAEIRRLAMFDTLTGIYNRGAFMELAERELARARRAGTPFAVLMLDLDHFKGVNDQFGHQAGDRVLAEFAAVAGRCLRTEDLVGRYGGEEFCAVLPGAVEGQAIAIAERIRLSVAERALGGLPRPTTISIGIAVCGPGAPFVLDSAIARADEALYEAKNSGRNRVAALRLTPVKSASESAGSIQQAPWKRKAA